MKCNFRKSVQLGATALMLAGSIAAQAQMTGSGTRGTTENAPKSWIPYTSYGYVGANIGRNYYDGDACAFSFSCEDRSTGFKVYTGGKFSRYFGVELGYVNLGEADRNGGSISAQGANLGLIGSIPLGDRFNIFGKVGGLYSWTKVESPVPTVATGRKDGLGLSYGAGLQFDINKVVAIRADWDRYRLKFVNDRDDSDLYSIGVVFKF